MKNTYAIIFSGIRIERKKHNESAAHTTPKKNVASGETYVHSAPPRREAKSVAMLVTLLSTPYPVPIFSLLIIDPISAFPTPSVSAI
jgi:hypothetical protein